MKIHKSHLSYSENAVVHTNYADDGTVRGSGFVMKKNFTIPNGTSVYFLIDYTTYVPKGEQVGQVFVMPPAFTATDGPVYVVIYRGTDYVAGATVLHLYNPNTMHEKTESATRFTQGATGSVKGTPVLEYTIGGDGNAAGDAGGGSFFIRPNSGKTLVEVTNSASGPVVFNWFQEIFEI